ncbi:MAG TPA: signal peptide peptidase SppA [Fibrobacteraceae bacterium]|nr:signal peptide peptidase SppA [Fibrobacteraceae bacterium]
MILLIEQTTDSMQIKKRLLDLSVIHKTVLWLVPFGWVLLTQANAWSPLISDQPAVEFSHGLSGNPALLGAVDGPGWLAAFMPDSSGTTRLDLGAHTDHLGAGFQWGRGDDGRIDQSRWHTDAAFSMPGDFLFLGLRTTLWRSSTFSGNAWSATPGVLLRPFSILSLGWTGLDLLSTHEFSRRHQFGLAIRPVDAITVAFSASTGGVKGDDWKNAVLSARADLHWRGYEFGFGIPVRGGGDSIPWRLSMGIPLGEHQSIFASSRKNKFQGVGWEGHLARRPSPISVRSWGRLDLATRIAESGEGFFLMGEDALSLPTVTRQFRHLAQDPSVAGVVLNFDGMEAGSAVDLELRRGIQQLRAHGKRTVAYMTTLRPGLFLAASAADRVVLQPSSRVHLRGLSAEVMHYKGLLDWLGIKAELLRHGRYKSAVEPFLQDTMSTEAQADMDSLLGSLWHTVRDSIAVSRHLSVDSLDAIARLAPLTAHAAESLGLVDTVLYQDQLEAYVRTRQIAHWRLQALEPYHDDWRYRPVIAVVTLEGDIVDGAGGFNLRGGDLVGARAFSELVDDLRQTPDIAAVVLRINSPGGSAQAADILWHRLHTLAQDGLPMVASVGGMAASGGYYIACAAQRIVAEPVSLVGSIGVFGGKANLSGLYRKFGLNPVTRKTHISADAESMSRGFTDEERLVLQASMDDVYQRFVGVVAQARHLTPSRVDSLGEGRVFTGVQALTVGLVDTLGGLDVAVRMAADLAGIPQDADVATLHVSRAMDWQLEWGASPAKGALSWLNWLQDLEEPRVWALWTADLPEWD